MWGLASSWLALVLIVAQCRRSLSFYKQRQGVVFAVTLQPEAKSPVYGSRKSAVLSYLSWDNKLRFCKHNKQICYFWVSSSSDGSSVFKPRLHKVQQLLKVVQQSVSQVDLLMYTDIDVVLTKPSHWFDNSSIQTTLAAFVASNASIAMTLDLNYTTATRPNLGTHNRFQTGLVLLKSSKNTCKLLKAWIAMSKKSPLSAITRAENVRTANNTTTLNTALVTDSSKHNSDQWLFNELLHQQPHLNHQVYTLQPRRVFNAFPSCSETLVWNITTATHSTPNVAQYWFDLQLPGGDEESGESLAVHFAGVFGGSSIETGKEDPLVLLLAVHGFISRHLRFVIQLSGTDDTKVTGWTGSTNTTTAGVQSIKCVQCKIISNSDAGSLLTKLLRYINTCLYQAFSVDNYTSGTSESLANNCLDSILQQSKNLFTNIDSIDALASKTRRKGRIYRCCD